MKSFEHANAGSVQGALALLEAVAHSRMIAGGTDLVGQMKLGMTTPSRLVNLKTIPDLDYIRFDEANGLQIGALATLTSITEHEAVRTRYQALAEAISLAASPQLRNRGTLGGNLCQSSRCWYYRGSFPCWLKGGEMCHAENGENAHHALFSGGPCYTVHPSDPAPALVALGAEVRIAGPEGERTVPIERLFQSPREGSRQLTVLQPSEILVEIKLPSPGRQDRGIYLKAMDRKAWAFALTSVAARLSLAGGIVADVRLVLGGVAPTPWRVPAAEAVLRGQPLNDDTIAQAADLAAAGAQPLRQNRYKVPLIRGLVAQALTNLGS